MVASMHLALQPSRSMVASLVTMSLALVLLAAKPTRTIQSGSSIPWRSGRCGQILPKSRKNSVASAQRYPGALLIGVHTTV